MTKTILIVLSLLLFITSMKAQEAEKQRYMRAFTGIGYSKIPYSRGTPFRNTDLLKITPSYELACQHLLHKFEIADYIFIRSINPDGGSLESISGHVMLKAQYEFDYMLYKAGEKRIDPYAGAAVSLKNMYNWYKPGDNPFYSRQYYYNFIPALAVALGAKIKLGKRTDLDINFPFSILEYTRLRGRQYDQAGDEMTRTKSDRVYSSLSKGNKDVVLQFRFGFGYRL